MVAESSIVDVISLGRIRGREKAELALLSRRGKDSAAANSGLIQICDEKHYRDASKCLAGESAAGIRLATSPSRRKEEGKFLLGLLPGYMV